ncbi:transferrin-binding protein-like solute binding protein [Hoeflea sp. G2-23]|uniref:Transferrin-binding protein-like solute binding protein n=1 Tax=Hoeflea algicola TaxID=2983763 RepID=A0ABT3Z4U5_9HYPH|nr:transferrin-binding protein-like solute binding protein [Hoeflea algicola]MCY0146782.1 transferrin-binding protein-like solute binding protein [Hoeflea algicola]
MDTKFTLVAIAAIPLVLTGCNKTLTAMDIGDLLAADATDTAAKHFNAGTSLKASKKTTVTKTLDYTKNTIAKAPAADFSVTKNKTGGVDMNVNGEVVSFAAADKFIEPDGTTSFGYEKNPNGGGDYKGLFSWSGSINDLEAGTDTNFLQVWNYYSDTDGMGTRGFAVVGAETKPDTIKALPNATYTGYALAETALANDRKTRTRVRGDLALNADFAAGNVNGTISNLMSEVRNGANNGWDPRTPQNGQIAMGTSSINANGFTGGTVSGDAAFNTAIDGDIAGSTYSGRFYGPNAEDVGGVLDITGTSDGDVILGNGFFAGGKN